MGQVCSILSKPLRHFSNVLSNVFERKILEEEPKLIQRSKQGPIPYTYMTKELIETRNYKTT